MKKYFFDSSFKIKSIEYENILENFKIYKIELDSKEFYSDKLNQAMFFKKVRKLENINSFYFKESLYMLGNKKFKVDNFIFCESFLRGEVQEINKKEELEKVDNLIILNLLVKYISYKISICDKKNIKYLDSNLLYLYIKKKEKDIFKFFKCYFENSKISDDYILNLTQTTFASENLFKNKEKLKKAVKIGYDSTTRVLVTSEKGNYYEKNPNSREVVTQFLIEKPIKLIELRSYYFTMIKNLIDEFLSEFITLEFNTLENFEHHLIKANKSYFKSKIKKLNKDINIYRIKDINSENKEIIARENFEGLDIYMKLLGLNGINLIDKGIADIDTNFEDPDSWNIFLLNDSTGENLLYDGYKQIKRKYNIISNGLYLDDIFKELKIKNELKAKIIRVIEELFIKDAIKNREISNLHSKSSIFEGISCFYYKNYKIAKLTILKKGKIEIEVSKYNDDDNLNKEFIELLNKFDLKDSVDKDFQNDGKKITTLNLKFIRINNKDIYIFDTGMRVYFDSNEYLKQYYKNTELDKLKNIKKGLNDFLGMSMAIRINKKDNLYYSFYDSGINLKEKFSPNIKKIICKENLEENDYFLFCESLVFKYLSNGRKLSTYPFFFKLLSEILENFSNHI